MITGGFANFVVRRTLKPASQRPPNADPRHERTYRPVASDVDDRLRRVDILPDRHKIVARIRYTNPRGRIKWPDTPPVFD